MSNSCKTFENILNQINEKGISSKEELMLYPELYSQYWSAAEVFANFCLASKANEANVETLKKYGITTYDDIKQDSIIKLITILDSMFFLKDKNKNIIKRRSTKHQYNYAYTCVNHLVNDQFEKLPPEDIKIIPLEGTVTNNYSNEDSDTTYSEIIGDDRYNGERIYLENENIKELTDLLLEKRKTELSEKRSNVLKELEQLSKKPAETLVRMSCVHLNIKPLELANLILEKGVESTYASALIQISKKYKISISEIKQLISTKAITKKSLMVDSDDVRIISAQISRLIYRANQNIIKQK